MLLQLWCSAAARWITRLRRQLSLRESRRPSRTVEKGEYVPELWEDEAADAGAAVIRTGKMWKAILNDLWRGVPASRIAARFHAWDC